jgi:hypothetical protein
MAVPEEVDLEFISAFIDGRLSGDDRQRALRILAESESAFEVYSDALRARADLSDSAVVPIAGVRSRRIGIPWRTVGPVAAAAAVLIAVFPVVQARRDRAVIDATSAELVRPIMGSVAGRTLLGSASDERGWSVTRGGGTRLVDSTVAFRLGVRAVDLQIAVAQRDTLRADRMAREILESLNSVELSDAVKAEYTALVAGLARGDESDQLIAAASRAEEGLDDLLQSFWFDFGRWVGMGESAARARSEEFFADKRTTRFLESAAERGGELSESDAAVLLQIGVLAGQGVTGEEFDKEREALRSFSVDRIQHARLLEDAARDLADEELDQHLASSYGIFSGTPKGTATIVFSPKAARWVADEHWHSKQEGRFLPDGRYQLKRPYSNAKELLMDVLRYGADAEITEPTALREQAKTLLQLALSAYQD